MPIEEPIPGGDQIFSLNKDYINRLVYFEQIEKSLDEKFISDSIKNIKSLNEHIQSIHVLFSQRELLIVSTSSHDVNRIEASILNLFKDSYPNLARTNIPLTNSNVSPVLLVGEVTNVQLRNISEDKLSAIKNIESKTGLKFKQIKDNCYFTGLLFQFLILNELFNEKNKVLGEISQNVQSDRNTCEIDGKIEKTSNSGKIKIHYPDWKTLYNESEVKGYFKIKPKQENDGENDMPDVFYEIYIFQADLTDLNTDGLVNAANPDLHPGYTGDGIARRIREKAGKQLQDACKRIIRQEHNNELIQEGEVVLTKATGKLKSKYVLHAVAPTWTKHILNNINSSTINQSRNLSPASSLSSMTSSMTSSPTSSTSSTSICIGEKFEYLMEKTLANILNQAHDPKLQLSSLALPVSSSTLGGAFDLPVELCAHSLYTQLCDYKANKSTCLKTFCITSLESDTVKKLCEIFSNYTDNYSETSWAMPLSPMTRLVNTAIQEKVMEKTEDSTDAEDTLIENKISKNQLDEIQTTNQVCIDENHNKNTDLLRINDSNNISLDKPDANLSGLMSNDNSRTMYDLNKKVENLTVTIQINDEKIKNNSDNAHINNRLITMDEQTISKIKTNRQNKPRTVSNSSSSYSSDSGFDKSRLNFGRADNHSNSTLTDQFKNIDTKIKCDSSCLFCQRENKNHLVTCPNDNCKTAYCQSCISNYFINQKNQKCPSCRSTIEKGTNKHLKERHSSSPEQTKPISIHNTNSAYHSNSNDTTPTDGFNYNRLKFNHNNHRYHHHQNNNNNNSSHSIQASHLNKTNTKHAITKAKVYVRILDEPCDGYENYKTLMITFEIEDGIQNDNHPRPGLPYKGTSKKVFLPEVSEHREILAFYERALNMGRLFKIAFSRNHDDYRVLLNQDVLLKTNQHGGGRFGYPDHNYVKDLLYMARNCK